MLVSMSRLSVPAALLAAATVLLAPSLWLGTLPSNNSPQNITWASQFSDQVRAGILYPRWLPESFDGLGGPTFYFYPPLPYWLDAGVDLLTLHRVPVDRRLSIDFGVLLWLSGLAMYAFLRALPVQRVTAVIGALAYMATPYHLFDHYVRGAYAEFAAFGVVPLVALGIRWVAMRHRFGLALLALAYAALALSHLPSALLVSISLVPGYVGYLAWSERRKDWLRFGLVCGLALGLGLALAAVYVLPALRLQPYISTEHLWRYRPESWLLLVPSDGRDTDYMLVLDSIAAGGFLAALGALLLLRRHTGSPGRGEAAFWAILALAGLALMAGLVPYFWQVVPLVAKVQFPWRLLVVVEFAIVAALCLAPWSAGTMAIRLLFTAAVLALLPGLAYIALGTSLRMDLKGRGDVSPAQDVREYLPAGYPHKETAAFTDLGLEPVKDVPLIACMPAAEVCAATTRAFGALDIRIKSAQPTMVTVRRFYFPSWQLEPSAPLSPSQPLRVVSFTSDPGDRTYRLRPGTVREEFLGGVVSLLALAALAGLAAASLRRREGW
jgi:6-pyruvoyl-tetrahydropterin synthase-like protein